MGETSNDIPTKSGAEIVEEKRFRRISRRELLKLSPVLVLGGILIPKLREPILSVGTRLSDSAAHASFRGQHLAETFTHREVAPPEKFPFNYYDVLDPEVDLGSWSLSVSGLV